VFRRFHSWWVPAVVLCLAALGLQAWAATPGFSPQTRVGLRSGDQWEPAIAADGYGHVYVLYPQYLQVPGCTSCPIPSMILVESADNGASWRSERRIATRGSAQFDPQVVVDPVDRRTVYAAWLENDRRDIVIARSIDFGLTWTEVVATRTETEADKPVLAVHGLDVYVAYNRAAKVWVAASHDGGNSFTAVNVNPSDGMGWAQAGGAAIDPAGNFFVSWAGYTRAGNGQGPVDLYVSRSGDGGKNWLTTLMDVSGAPPECATNECGWAYLGAQITMTADAAGTLYALWNAGPVDKGAERVYFASSTTAGLTWSTRIDVSNAAYGVAHAFPTIVAGTVGDVRIAWMDTRENPLWNTYYRSSTNGGATWSSVVQLSSYVPGFNYIDRKGFKFPFGDYFEMDIDNRGDTQIVWGEGLTYESPGSIWYSNGR
jgi:BNR repeat-like domain